MKKIIILLAAAALTACALPTTQVNVGSSRPTLSVTGAPSNVKLVVDGLEVGLAATYNGAPKTLLIEEGPHQVELRDGSTVLMSRKILATNGENTKIAYGAEGSK